MVAKQELTAQTLIGYKIIHLKQYINGADFLLYRIEKARALSIQPDFVGSQAGLQNAPCRIRTICEALQRLLCTRRPFLACPLPVFTLDTGDMGRGGGIWKQGAHDLPHFGYVVQSL